MACLAACSDPQNPAIDSPAIDSPAMDSPINPPINPPSGSSPLFSTLYYESFEDFYQGLNNFPQDKLELIRIAENQTRESTRATTVVSENEKREGIFEHVRNKLLEENTLLFPFYQGKQIQLANQVIFNPSGVFKKPEITFGGYAEGLYLGFGLRFYDESLIEEANKRGASWLMSQMEPDGLNVYNYESKRDSATFVDGTKSKMTVYEKEYRLGDRDVMAMVIDNSFLSTNPVVTIYFVYDDMLISVNFNPEKVEVEKILAEITFHKVYLPTNTPMEGE